MSPEIKAEIKKAIAYYEKKRDECLSAHCVLVASKHQRMVDSWRNELARIEQEDQSTVTMQS